MRRYPLIWFFFMLPIIVRAQTPISGIINNYYKVIEVIPAKSCVRVDNPLGLSYNDQVMIIQMKGVTVNTTNSNVFGAVTSMNNAGNYEVNTICWIKSDSIFLYKNLFQSYTVANQVQLVRIPQYERALVTDSLKAAPWDSTSGKGGVLALTVYDQLILSAPISANGAGFRGGAYATSNSTCSNFTAPNGYYYNASALTPQSGAYKGESASETSITYSGGKGAFANGGGGGNNHNNGGGGGAHMGAGGAGGGNSSTSGCTVSNPGIGGYALSSNNGSKIFLGGGGGAGHANSGLPSAGGGNGGGIVFIQTNNLYSNGYKIMANGWKGGNTTGDGASGGGAGGTVILVINNYVDALNAEAAGGSGGTESDDNTSQKCYGEGGGGGGGIIYCKTALPAGTITAAAGAKGIKQFYLNCAPLVAAAPGSPGNIVAGYTFMQSNTISNYCEVILPVQLLRFSVCQVNEGAQIVWQLAETPGIKTVYIQRRQGGKEWENIAKVEKDDPVTWYHYEDQHLAPGMYQYRLQFIDQNGKSGYSMIRTLRMNVPSSRLVIYPNPASGLVNLYYPFQSDRELRIINSMGTVVVTRKLSGNRIFYQVDVAKLNKGMYRVVIDGQCSSLVVE